ncbi:UDP-2,3-diacylglucosamine diphosphatase LpxI [Alphaproteobacteria bacterium]|nr:UDP-2,3-diacylglucosamine diphosphatase LpxI [Alphaproteobacteria bacterium]
MQSANLKMEIKIPKLAIIAGNGSIPFYLIEECNKIGREYCLIIIEGHGKELSEKYDPDYIVSLSKMGRAVKYVKNIGIKHILMVGGVKRPSLKNIIPDLWTAKFLTTISSKVSGDNSVLSKLTKALEREGFIIVAPEEVLPNLICPKGTLGKVKPNQQNNEDISTGYRIAKIIGANDIGQSIIIENGLVIAVEAAEGTDRMIKRSLNLKKEKKAGVLIKVIKPMQDKRIDRPVIGIDTIKAVKKAGLDGIALESNEILILNYSDVILYADEEGLFVEGI